jgi:hypothetical protein
VASDPGKKLGMLKEVTLRANPEQLRTIGQRYAASLEVQGDLCGYNQKVV